MSTRLGTRRPNPRTLARLKRQMQRAGITQVSIARHFGIRPEYVCNVLAGRKSSRRVVKMAEWLVADAQRAVVSA